MSKLHLKLSEITVLPQPRKIFRDIPALADDIREHGLLQPPTITPNRRLLMGERRFRACKLLGLESIDFNIYEKELTDDEILEIQVAENVARDDLSWQERALSMLEIYLLKRQRGALEGWSWGQREASALFKIQLGTVNYVLRVAAKLKAELDMPEDQRKYWGFDSAADAYRNGLLAEEEDRMLAELAKREQTSVNSSLTIEARIALAQSIPNPLTAENIAQGIEVLNQIEVSIDEARARYEANPLNTVPYNDYLKEKQSEQSERDNTIYLSSRITHADSITYMNAPEHANMFDHILTDIPYGIDMDNLDQSDGGITGVDRTTDAHDVQENLSLHQKFFPAAFKCTKEKSYVITFCDMMEFRRMVDLAELAGFTCQRWPLIWPKAVAMNSSAHCNTTKNYEIALICHKPGATFVNKLNTSFLPIVSSSAAKKDTGHAFSKPYEVTRILVDTISHPRQRILDPFAGGGSMVLEMLRMGREAFGVEKAEHQYNALLENVKQQYYLKLNPKFIFK